MKVNSRLKLPVIMATDCGADMDDQWALAHLALSPEIDLRGVVTTHTGDYPVFTEPAAESSAGAAREVLDRLPLRSRPPVIAGSSRPLKDKAVPMLNSGVELILRESRRHGRNRRLTVVVTGAATDVASALICDPSLQGRIEIVAMAFDKWPEGGDVFNVKNDTKAWQVLLESNAPIVVGDGEVARKHLGMTPERANELFHSCGPVGQYLAGLHASWIAKHKDLVREFSGSENLWPVWDEVTVAYLLKFANGTDHARPRMRDDTTFDRMPESGPTRQVITWITSIDSDRLWADFRSKMKSALKRQGATTR